MHVLHRARVQPGGRTAATRPWSPCRAGCSCSFEKMRSLAHRRQDDRLDGAPRPPRVRRHRRRGRQRDRRRYLQRPCGMRGRLRAPRRHQRQRGQAPEGPRGDQKPDCGWFYRRDAEAFKQIPGTPIAYWASDALLNAFVNAKQLNEFGKPRQGLATGDNERFTRLWWEPEIAELRFDAGTEEEAFKSGRKWFSYNKGGNYRKWYGNNDWVVAFNRPSSEILATLGNHLPSRHLYFKPMLTWSKVSSGVVAFRFRPKGSLFDVAGTSIFGDEKTLRYLQGACNSSVIMQVASMLSPTLNFEVGQIATYPIIQNENLEPSVNATVDSCRELSKKTGTRLKPPGTSSVIRCCR